MAPIRDVLDRLAEDFDLLGDWESRLEHIIDLGRGLEPLSASERVEANRVRGCASQVWVVSQAAPDGRIRLRADSDAQIPKGLIAVLLSLYDGRLPHEIAELDPGEAAARLGLERMLTTQRANGLGAMVSRIRAAAS